MRRWPIALAGALVVVLSACGTSSGPSKDAFVKDANARCQSLRDADDAGRAALGASPSASDRADYLRGSWGPVAISTYQQIAGLAMPATDKDRIAQLLTDAIAEVRLLEADPASGGNIPNQRELVRRFAAEGLTACGAGFAAEVTKPDFLQQVGRVCAALSTNLANAMQERGITDATPPEVRSAFVRSVIVPLQRKAADQIEALGAPSGDEAVIADILVKTRADIDIYETDPAQYFTSRPTFVALQQQWQAYGGSVCVYG